jgi:hypothetical protein
MRFVQGDARAADLSDGTVFYLYTPFTGTILRDVLNLLRDEAVRREIRICTFGLCTPAVAEEQWLSVVGTLETETRCISLPRLDGGTQARSRDSTAAKGNGGDDETRSRDSTVTGHLVVLPLKLEASSRYNQGLPNSRQHGQETAVYISRVNSDAVVLSDLEFKANRRGLVGPRFTLALFT